jgi:hypothetical protein
MMRRHLPFLPLPVLAVLVAISACSKPRSDDTTHVIPPAAPYVAAAAERIEPAAAPQPSASPGLGVRAISGEDDLPSAEEVKEFERPVRK